MPLIGSERTHQLGFGGWWGGKDTVVLIPASRVIELETPKQAAVSVGLEAGTETRLDAPSWSGYICRLRSVNSPFEHVIRAAFPNLK